MWWRRRREYEFVYTHRKVRRHGRRDGRAWRWTFWPFRKPKLPTPALNQVAAAEFETELKEAAEADIAGITARWHDEDEKLKREYCEAYAEYLNAEAAAQPESREAEDAAKALHDAREELFALDFPAMSPRWALFWLVLIGFGEFFVNSSVFQLLGAGRWETYLAAIAVGVAIPLAGHLLGQALRQDEKNVWDYTLIVLAPVGIFAGLYALALFRARFAEARGLEIARVLGVRLTGEEFTRSFLLLNVLLFLVAAACAYAGSHRDAPRYRKAWKKYRLAKKALKKESREARAAVKRLECAARRLQKTRVRRAKRYQKYRQNALDLKATAEWFTRLYRTENVRARPDGRPKCFDQEVPAAAIQLPDAFRDDELEDWDCSEIRREAEVTLELEQVAPLEPRGPGGSGAA